MCSERVGCGWEVGGGFVGPVMGAGCCVGGVSKRVADMGWVKVGRRGVRLGGRQMQEDGGMTSDCEVVEGNASSFWEVGAV